MLKESKDRRKDYEDLKTNIKKDLQLHSKGQKIDFTDGIEFQEGEETKNIIGYDGQTNSVISLGISNVAFYRDVSTVPIHIQIEVLVHVEQITREKDLSYFLISYKTQRADEDGPMLHNALIGINDENKTPMNFFNEVVEEKWHELDLMDVRFIEAVRIDKKTFDKAEEMMRVWIEGDTIEDGLR